MRKEDEGEKKGKGTPSGLGIMKLLGYCENRICEQVSMIGFEDTERKTSTLVEECILNCSNGMYFKKIIQMFTQIILDNEPDDIQEL